MSCISVGIDAAIAVCTDWATRLFRADSPWVNDCACGAWVVEVVETAGLGAVVM